MLDAGDSGPAVLGEQVIIAFYPFYHQKWCVIVSGNGIYRTPALVRSLLDEEGVLVRNA